MMNIDFKELERRAGIHFMGVQPMALDTNISYDLNLAMDAQPALVTTGNSGIPAFLSTFIDPKIIEVLVAPTKAVDAVGAEVKKGDWVTETAMFPVVEGTGVTTAYGDYSEGGATGVNTNFPQRQAYHYQVMTQWGERELERAGLAKIDFAARVNMVSVSNLMRRQNSTYIFGVSGLQNYGMLNDPLLPASLTPATKAAGGVKWVNNGVPNATALEVLKDVQSMYYALQSRLNGHISLDSDMTFILSPKVEVALTITNEFNVSVSDLLKKNYPNLKVETVPQYSTASGEQVQLVANNIDGQRTWDCCFTEKLRAHPVVVGSSSFKQKKSQGTWGTVIYRPGAVQGMLGV
jgi:hypothetical protein